MNIAVILAGGTGQRMKSSGKPKQFIELYDKPIIAYTLSKFEDNPNIDKIVVVCLNGWKSKMEKLVKKYTFTKVMQIVDSGETRQLSIHSALKYLAENVDKDDLVMIHDGVRPMISDRIIDENVLCAKQHGNAFTVVKCNESILVSEDHISSNEVPNRAHLFIEQGPQTLRFEEVYQTFNALENEGIQDLTAMCDVWNHYGKNMFFVEGDYKNIKITTPSDYYIFRALKDFENNKDALGY